MTDGKVAPIMTSRIGAVTFLDVLGWKGIWQRKNTAVKDLQSLARVIDRAAQEQTRGKGGGIPVKGIGPVTRVLIVSDTLVIATEAEPKGAQDALEVHGKLCEKAIPESIQLGIPVRGATSFGEFFIENEEKILVGKAIDEAASWYELVDWIGVFMSPSATYSFDGSKSVAWVEYTPPLKNSIQLKTYAVKWFRPHGDSNSELMSMKRHFALMSPIVPEFSDKFQNTIRFITSDHSA